MPCGCSPGSAEADENASSSSGNTEGTLAGGAVAGASGEGVVVGGLSGVVVSCPTASCGPRPRMTNAIIVAESKHRAIAPRTQPATFKPTPPALGLTTHQYTGDQEG